MSAQKRLLVVFGPTAGHIYPAVAFAAAYHHQFQDADLRFAGPAEDAIDGVLSTLNLTCIRIPGAPFATAPWRASVAALPRVCGGVRQAQRLVRALGTRLVVGFGGYTTGQVLAAAWSIGVRTVLHECNTRFGLANRLAAPLADRVCLGSTRQPFATGTSTRVATGIPIREAIARLAGGRRSAPCPDRPARILVLNGTGDGSFLVAQVPLLLRELRVLGKPVKVLHQCGRLDPKDVNDAYRSVNVDARAVRQLPDMAPAYLWADFVISRAGASTIAELSTAGLPSLLVPLRNAAANHQYENGHVYARDGAAIVVREEEWDARRLAARVAAVVLDERAWGAAHDAARAVSVPDAAGRLVSVCESLMEGRW